jgi:uncharacterized membrane protein (DUF4010 family)
MALVVLPLLPEGPYGPLGGIQPRALWALVLFFSGLSFLGYVARCIAGPGHGYLVTGLLGGLVSSTNVTFTFARLSRSDPAGARALAFGAVAANAMLYPRVIVAVSVLKPVLLYPLIPLLAGPALIAAVAAASGAGRVRAAGAPDLGQRNPLQLGAALQMAILFQVVMVVVHVAREVWGHAGVLTSAAVLGLTDVDALTVSMARGAEAGSAALAAVAIAIGVLANTVLKLSLALLFGETRFRAIAGGTLAVMVLAASAVLLLHASIVTHPSEVNARRDQATVAVARPAPARQHQGSVSTPVPTDAGW